MAGQLVCDGGDLCFVPRFPFVAGTAYAVSVGGADAAVLVRPEPTLAATTEVLGIWPTSAEVPRNLLRMYVLFSAPMSEGYAAVQVRVVDDAGQPLAGALLPADGSRSCLSRPGSSEDCPRTASPATPCRPASRSGSSSATDSAMRPAAGSGPPRSGATRSGPTSAATSPRVRGP